MHLEQLAAIRTIFNNFKNLGATELQLENVEFTHKMDELVNDLEQKLELKELLSEEIESLINEIDTLKETIEVVNVEMIRSKQETKRVKKEIDKLKSLNLSRINIDFSKGDKEKIGRGKSKILLLKLLTRIISSPSGDGKYCLQDMNGENHVNIISLNKNKPKELNTEELWEGIGQCSPYNAEWEALFNN